MATSRRTPPPRRAAASAAPRSSGVSGASSVLRKAQEEAEKADARRAAAKEATNMPFRFRMPPGESREVIIVDDEPRFARMEHNLQDPRSQRWSVFTACIAEDSHCPVCDKHPGRPPYFAMYFTIIDLTPFDDKDGNEIEWSKKLLVVKQAQQKKFMRIFDREKTLRGIKLEMIRDGEKDANIGNEIEVLGFVEEEDLLTYETEYEDKEGKVHPIIGHEPFDYETLFPQPTERTLAALAGGSSSRDDDRDVGRSRGRSRDDDDEGGDGWKKEGRGPASRTRPASSAARTRPASRPAREEPDDDAPSDDERPARRAAPAARTRPASRTIDHDDRPDVGADPDDVNDDDRPQRTARPAARPAARTATRPASRTRQDPEDDAGDDADPPEDRHSTMASRRAALRGGSRGR